MDKLSMFKHVEIDKEKTRARLRVDLLLTLLAAICVGLYAAFSIQDIMTKTTYEGICSNDVTAGVLCDDWSFRQCSYFGDQIGTKMDPESVAPSRTKEECEISSKDGCPVFDISDANFCTNWKGGQMEPDGKLYKYLWTGPVNSETVQWMGEPTGDSYMCCGQIEQTIGQKLIIWLGVLGGTAGVIVKVISAIPVNCVVPKTNALEEKV